MATSIKNLSAEMLLRLLSFLDTDTKINLLRSSHAIQGTLAHDKKVFMKIVRKLDSQSPLWDELYKLYPLIINNISSGTVESMKQIPDITKEMSAIEYQKTWASELFFLISCQIRFNSEDEDIFGRSYYHVFVFDLQTMNSTLIKDKELFPIHVLWRNFLVRPEWRNNKHLAVTRIVTSSDGQHSLEDDVPKAIFGEDFNYDSIRSDQCGDTFIFWDQKSIIVIDLKQLEDYWGSPTLPAKVIQTGIISDIPNYEDDNYTDEMEDMDYALMETPREATKSVKTLVFEILQVRQCEDGPIFLRRINRKFVAINVDTSSPTPRIATISWEARLTTGVHFGWMSHVQHTYANDHNVCSSGHVEEFAFFGPNNTLGIKLKDQQLIIHRVELKKINLMQSKIHFTGKVIILQDLCPAGALRASDILCFNLHGDIVWSLDSISMSRDTELLGYPRLELLPLIMINNGLLLLHEVVSRVPDVGENLIPDPPAWEAPDLIRVFWLGFRQINVYSLEYPGYFRIKRRNAEIIDFA